MTHDLDRALREGSLSRRTLLKTASALGGAAALSPLASTRVRAQPRAGGTIRVGLGSGSTTDTLDPGTYENEFTIHLSHVRTNALTEVAASGHVQGELAESWEASPDAKVWTFKLRQGAEFHNGKSLTTEDVIASLNHHRGEDSASAAKPIVDPIVDMQADGDSVVITLAEGNADFPFILSDYHLMIFPVIDGALDFSVGSGGYVLDSWEPGVRAEFSRFANYWKSDVCWFDGVELLTIGDTTARMNALMTGEVDLIDRIDLQTVALMQRNPEVRVQEVTGAQHFTFAMDTRAEPFNDPNVRLALKYGINRQAMVDTVLSGFGGIGNDHPIGPSYRYHDASLEQREYDPDRARFHLGEAGLDSLTVPLHVAEAAFAGATDAGILYQESARDCGITIDVIREPNDGYWSNVWMVAPWSAVYWGGRPTEDWMLTTAYAAGAAWNDSFWDNTRFNELLVQARGELDESLRAEMYSEMQLLIRDDGGIVLPMFAKYVNGLSARLETPEQIGSNWNLDGHRACERWWFAE